MNVSKAIEIGFAVVFRTCAELGEGVVIRAWQSLYSDGSWNKEKDRAFPSIAITCGVPRYNSDQETLYCDCEILCGTAPADDADHAVWAKLYGAIQEAADKMFAQFKARVDGTELAAFKETVSAECGSTVFNGVAGLEFTDGGLDPMTTDRLNMGGIVVRVHYSRNDY